jgi:hypothetical protein
MPAVPVKLPLLEADRRLAIAFQLRKVHWKCSQQKTDFGGYVEIIPGDHGLSKLIPKRIANEMAAKFRASGLQ